ncbi:MAG: c-type cytochrome [Sulfurimonadaceae bacterium]|jgi:cytochrome c553|nr:c-type cytochrome [Sulfurimonadaceae bacterium]
MRTKDIIVGTISVLVVALMAYTASNGGAFQGGSNVKIIDDMGVQAKVEPQSYHQEHQPVVLEDDKEEKELQALKDKAGNMGIVKISAAYRSKCAACHGIDGSGLQDGKQLMGPKLYGQDSETIYKDLIDFKAGRKENVVMKGLLINTTEEEIRAFADEIGAFATQNQE